MKELLNELRTLQPRDSGYAELAGRAADEIERLRKIEAAARALTFAAYPAHGSGFVMQVIGGNINDLEAALRAD